MRAPVLATLAAAILTLAVVARADDPPPPADAALAADAFAIVHRVLTSPRCRNCHPAGDRPLVSDRGIPHPQNISRRSPANGLHCSACHRDHNGRRGHAPPGAPRWDLPPAATPMVFEGRTPHQLCEQLKDPAQTGGRDLEALFVHVDRDPLVLWGWSPGLGRRPVPVPHDQFAAAFRRWIDHGAGCPP